MNRRLCVTLVLCLCVAAGCPKKPEELMGGDPNKAVGDPGQTSAQVPKSVTECEDEPAWVAMTPCRNETMVFAKAKVTGTTAMTRQMALRHARAELTKLGLGKPNDAGAVILEGSEAFDTFLCGEQTYGVARMSAAEFASQNVPVCPQELVASSTVVGECPAWTRRGAWKEGDDIVAVGFVSGLKNRMLAMSTVKNRAMAEARYVVSCEVLIKEAGVETKASGPAPGVPKETEVVDCDGGLYAKVVFGMP